MPLPTTAPSEALRSLNTFSLHVTVHIKPEDLDSFYEAMKPVFEAVCNEPELLYFEMFQDPDEPGKLSWVENWNASVEWLMKVRLPLLLLLKVRQGRGRVGDVDERGRYNYRKTTTSPTWKPPSRCSPRSGNSRS